MHQRGVSKDDIESTINANWEEKYFDKIEDKIIELRGEKVIIDSDVAELYGVETKRINEAVRNNTDRFPEGYIIEITKDEFDNLRSKISTSSWGGRRHLPK